MDTYLPFRNNELVFDNFGRGHSTWGPYLEKAFAKVNGNYEMIAGGTVPQGLYFLTGATTRMFTLPPNVTSAGILASWIIGNATANDWIIGADCGKVTPEVT